MTRRQGKLLKDETAHKNSTKPCATISDENSTLAESTVRREVTEGTLCQLAVNSVGPSVNVQRAEVEAALQKLNFGKAAGRQIGFPLSY